MHPQLDAAHTVSRHHKRCVARTRGKCWQYDHPEHEPPGLRWEHGWSAVTARLGALVRLRQASLLKRACPNSGLAHLHPPHPAPAANPYVALTDAEEKQQGLAQRLQELQVLMKRNYKAHRRRTLFLLVLSALYVTCVTVNAPAMVFSAVLERCGMETLLVVFVLTLTYPLRCPGCSLAW